MEPLLRRLLWSLTGLAAVVFAWGGQAEHAAGSPGFVEPSPCGRTLLASHNLPLSFEAAAGDAGATITATTLPGAASFASGATSAAGTFSWTPRPQQRGLQGVTLEATGGAVCAVAIEVVHTCDHEPQACHDADADGVVDGNDLCPTVPDAAQRDWDHDLIGDACDDADGDGVLDAADNCVTLHNPGQADWDRDGRGDVCDDSDVDGHSDANDNCHTTRNADQRDTDMDGRGDACDPLVRQECWTVLSIVAHQAIDPMRCNSLP